MFYLCSVCGLWTLRVYQWAPLTAENYDAQVLFALVPHYVITRIMWDVSM
jgi:hypothetical protein